MGLVRWQLFPLSVFYVYSTASWITNDILSCIPVRTNFPVPYENVYLLHKSKSYINSEVYAQCSWCIFSKVIIQRARFLQRVEYFFTFRFILHNTIRQYSSFSIGVYTIFLLTNHDCKYSILRLFVFVVISKIILLWCPCKIWLALNKGKLFNMLTCFKVTLKLFSFPFYVLW